MRSRKQGVKAAIGLLVFLASSRVAVLFLESLSVVSESRKADAELLELCVAGQARGSEKFRTACLQARQERASPVVLKAVVRAVAVAFDEFRGSCSSPVGLLTMILFVVSSLLLPIVPTLRLIASAFIDETRAVRSRRNKMHDSDSDDDDDLNRIIVLNERRSSGSLHKRLLGTLPEHMA